MEVYHGQVLFLLGIVVPLVFVCCCRWMCGKRQPNNGSPSNAENAPSTATEQPARRRPVPYQEVIGPQRSLSYYDPPNGDPPPSYESVLRHSGAPTLTYVDETGHVKHVKWDGTGSIPTRTVLGQYNPSFEMAEDSISSQNITSDDTTANTPNEGSE